MNAIAGETGLEALRARLDRIDADLMRLVRDRLRVCLEIAEVKRVHDVPMMQPHRVRFVKDRADVFARQHGLDPTFLVGLYDTIIQEACRMEEEVIGRRIDR